VRVTDENDRPAPDTPVLFLLSGGGAGSGGAGGGGTGGGVGSGNVGSFAGQPSLRAMTNSQGIAQVDYTAGEVVGSQAQLKVQVEGSDASWEGTLLIISAFANGSTPQNGNANANAKTVPRYGGLVVGQMPKPSIARQIFTTTEGKKFSLDSLRGRVVVMHFFGAWCDSSKRQVQSIRNLLASYQSEELQVIGMSVKDSRSTPQVFLQFITDQKVDYWVVQDVADKHFVEFVNSKDVSVPQTLIYGRDGRLVAYFFGFNQQVGAEMEQKIKGEFVKQ
jgi:peroxiredoxin